MVGSAAQGRRHPGLFPRSDFALIRGATSDIHHFPVSLQTYINANLTEHKHDVPSAETLEKAGHVSSAAVTLDAVKRLSMEMKVCLTWKLSQLTFR